MANTILAPKTVATQPMVVHFYGESIMVESQSTPDLLYKVEFNVELARYTCGCPDFFHRERACKHIRRVLAVMEVADSVKAASEPKHDGCPRCTRRLAGIDSSMTVLASNGVTVEIHPNCLDSSDEILEYRSHSYKLRQRLSEAA